MKKKRRKKQSKPKSTDMAKTVKSVRNGGRPKVNDEDRKDKVVSFRVDSLTKMAFAEKVEQSKLAMGEFMRRAVQNAEITPAQYEGYFREIENFDSARLLDLIAVSVTVIQPWSNEELKALKNLYRFAADVNALVKRGNAYLANAPIEERINYPVELARLQDEFNEIKEYFLKRVVGDDTTEYSENTEETLDEVTVDGPKDVEVVIADFINGEPGYIEEKEESL